MTFSWNAHTRKPKAVRVALTSAVNVESQTKDIITEAFYEAAVLLGDLSLL